jgi:hypothetical protein
MKNSTLKSKCCGVEAIAIDTGEQYKFLCRMCRRECQVIDPEFPAPLSDKLEQPDYERQVKWLWFLVGVAVFCNLFQFIIILSLIK